MENVAERISNCGKKNSQGKDSNVYSQVQDLTAEIEKFTSLKKLVEKKNKFKMYTWLNFFECISLSDQNCTVLLVSSEFLFHFYPTKEK